MRPKLRTRAQERPTPRTLLQVRPSRIQSRKNCPQGEIATSNPIRAPDTGRRLGEAISDSAVSMVWASNKAPRGERGYGYKYVKLRAALLPSAYGKPCARCGEPMLAGQRLHLDHSDHDRTKFLGFSHADCNLKAAAAKARRIQAAKKKAAQRPVHRW